MQLPASCNTRTADLTNDAPDDLTEDVKVTVGGARPAHAREEGYAARLMPAARAACAERRWTLTGTAVYGSLKA